VSNRQEEMYLDDQQDRKRCMQVSIRQEEIYFDEQRTGRDV
jgi:hypothetical protein